MSKSKYEIVTLPAYRAIGLKWDGSWQEISALKETIQSMSERVVELEHALNPSLQLGLSYHTRPDGFAHYSVYEVSEEQQIPEGMLEIRIPEWTYLKTNHQKGKDIGQSYYDIAQWLKDSQYKALEEADTKYFEDILPIKHERYPIDRDKNDPHFDILIPIVNK